MADFDPNGYQQPAQQEQPAAQQPQVEAAPKKGNKFTRNTNHPVAFVVFLVVKLWPLIYSIVDIFISKTSTVVTYIVQSCAIAVDFYNAKNFAGRYLARLRWHTYVVDGKTYYYFESMGGQDVSKFENMIFWAGMWFSVVYYILLIIGYAVTIAVEKLPIAIVAALASVVNLTAYIRCSSDAKKKIKAMTDKATQQASQAAVGYAVNNAMQSM